MANLGLFPPSEHPSSLLCNDDDPPLPIPPPSLDNGHSQEPDAQTLAEPHVTQFEDARTSLEREISERLEAKEREMLAQFEQQIAEAKQVAWENCCTEMAEKHSLEIKQLNTVHSEELKNALKANTLAYQAQIEALKELHQDRYDAVKQEYDTLFRQLAEQREETQDSNHQLQHIEEMERVLADFEESKKASDAEKELEIDIFRERITQLEGQLKQNSLEALEASHKLALHEKELEFQAHLQTQLTLMKDETENKLRSEFELKIHSLESEKIASDSELKETYGHQLLEIEAKHKDVISAIQAHCEQQLLEAKTIHSAEIEFLEKNQLSRENELIRAHEQQMKELIQSHSVEISSTQSQSDISDTLTTQSEPKLKVFSSPRPLSAGHAQLPKSGPKTKDDLVDVVQSETMLFSPSKMEQIRNRFSQQREQALAKSREMSPTQWSPTPPSPQRRPIRKGSPSKRNLDFELKLANLEEKMAAERKTQLNLLKEKHERDLAEIEKKRKKERGEIRIKLRAQLEDEHSIKTKQAVADCLADSDRKLIAAKKELECSHQKQISQLQSAHQAEIAALETDHNAKIEALDAKYKDELSRLECLKIDDSQEQDTEELKAQVLHHKAEMDSLQAQFQSQQESKMKELHERLKQECMAKFKTMAERLQQIHQDEVNTLKQDTATLASIHEESLQLLRKELDAEHKKNMAIVMEEHKDEIKSLHESYEEQLRAAEIDHAHRMKAITAQQDDQSEQLEFTVRYVHLSLGGHTCVRTKMYV